MTGSTNSLTDDEKKVFRIVRAVCEVACGGFLDGIDSSTSGITSLGPFVLHEGVEEVKEGSWVSIEIF